MLCICDVNSLRSSTPSRCTDTWLHFLGLLQNLRHFLRDFAETFLRFLVSSSSLSLSAKSLLKNFPQLFLKTFRIIFEICNSFLLTTTGMYACVHTFDFQWLGCSTARETSSWPTPQKSPVCYRKGLFLLRVW